MTATKGAIRLKSCQASPSAMKAKSKKTNNLSGVGKLGRRKKIARQMTAPTAPKIFVSLL
jgi:hypothetical protein